VTTRICLPVVAAVLAACALASAAEKVPAGKVTHQLGRAFLCSDYGANTISLVSKDGEIEWSFPARRPQDAWLLPNGNVLFTHVKGVQEVSRDKKVVWEYETAPENEVHACQPLPDGLVMIAESGPCRLIEVNREGKIVNQVKLTTKVKKAHGQMRGARKLASGNYLVGQVRDGVVREYDPSGRIVWEFKHRNAFMGIRLPNGNTLISTGDAHRVIEVDAQGKVVWQINENDLPGCPLRFVAGMQRLANGNTLIVNWGGHGHLRQQPQIVEVSRDKKIVARLWDDQRFKTPTSIFALGEKGDVRNFGLLR